MKWAFQLVRFCYLSKHLQSGTTEKISRSVSGNVIILFHFFFLAKGQKKKEHKSITAGGLFLTYEEIFYSTADLAGTVLDFPLLSVAFLSTCQEVW